MKKILFYDKHLAWNSPSYALPLLDDLRDNGFDVTVLVGKPSSDPVSDLTEKRLNLNYEDLYSSYPVIRFDKLATVYDLLREIQPDIYLANFSCYNVERKLLQVMKRLGIKTIELDNLASEIKYYNPKFIYWLSSLHPHTHVGTIKSYLHQLSRLYRLEIDIFKNSYKRNNLPFITDSMCLKGKYFFDYLTKDNTRKLDWQKLDVTGSLHYDYLLNANSSKEELFAKYGLDIQKPLVIFAPNPLSMNLSRFRPLYRQSLVSRDFIYRCIEKVKDNLDVNLMIKYHPRDYRNNRLDHESVPHVLGWDFYSLLKYSLALVSSRSSVGLETSLARVPILIDSREKILDFPYYGGDYSVGLPVDIDSIHKSLKLIINDQISFDFDKFNNYFTVNRDANSKEKILEVIKNIT